MATPGVVIKIVGEEQPRHIPHAAVCRRADGSLEVQAPNAVGVYAAGHWAWYEMWDGDDV